MICMNEWKENTSTDIVYISLLLYHLFICHVIHCINEWKDNTSTDIVYYAIYLFVGAITTR